MTEQSIVYGLLDTSAAIGDPSLAAKCRDLTITWSRYDYHGPIIEELSVDAILDRALAERTRYCFIQSHGQILRERWILHQPTQGTFLSALEDWMADQHGFIAGRILMAQDAWFGLDPGCLLVDLERYVECGRPPFGEPAAHGHELPVPALIREGNDISALQPSGRMVKATPRLHGWGFVEASLRSGLQVRMPPDFVRRRLVDLAPHTSHARQYLRKIVAEGIESHTEDAAAAGCSADQVSFLESVDLQAANARRGVFLVNIESYADVETPPVEFQTPVSTLYAVASGFKPNRILQTHGMEEATRVVFFDYSERALAVRRAIIEQWDGADFPQFIKRLFLSFPVPDTFYQLWAACTPQSIDWPAVEELWRRELDRLGGEAAFKEHWQAYRRLPHTFLQCDLLADPRPLFAHLRDEPGAVMWFSNAPFTVHSNWRYMLEERKAMYERWIDGLARLNPRMLLYGSDYANANVNCLAAGQYASLYREQDAGPLGASLRCQHAIRM